MGTDSIIRYRGFAGGRVKSPNIWHECPAAEIDIGMADGIHFFDDFTAGYELAAGSSLTKLGRYECIADSGASLTTEDDTTATDASGMWGAQEFVAGTTADADLVMQLGGGGAYSISSTKADAKKLVFEARLKVSTIVDGVSSFFVGLGEPSRAVNAGVFTTTQGDTVDTAMADAAFIGFWRSDADGNGLNFIYSANGQTAVDHIVDVHTLVADTYVKVGFFYNPDEIKARRIKVYADNVQNLATYVTSTNISAATFPEGEVMSPVIGHNNDDGSTACTLTVDWWGASQWVAGATSAG